MDKNEQINKLIEEAINSVDGVKRAQPVPFLLTRMRAGMNRKNESLWEKAGRFIVKPSFAIPGLSLLILLNVLTILSNRTGSTAPVNEQTAITTGDEYNYSVAAIYDLETTEPQ